jgi:hypothetical protein
MSLKQRTFGAGGSSEDVSIQSNVNPSGVAAQAREALREADVQRALRAQANAEEKARRERQDRERKERERNSRRSSCCGCCWSD